MMPRWGQRSVTTPPCRCRWAPTRAPTRAGRSLALAARSTTPSTAHRAARARWPMLLGTRAGTPLGTTTTVRRRRATEQDGSAPPAPSHVQPHIPASTSIIPSFKTLFKLWKLIYFSEQGNKDPVSREEPSWFPQEPQNPGAAGRWEMFQHLGVDSVTSHAPSTHPCDDPGALSKEWEWLPLVLLLIPVLAEASSALWRGGTGVSGTRGNIWERLWPRDCKCVRVKVCVCVCAQVCTLL